jgi:hypothetical protein
MANDLSSNTSQIVLKKFLPEFMSDLVTCKTVDRQIVADGDLNPDTGSKISVKRPHQYKANRTSDGDISSSTKSDLISGKSDAVVQDYITVAVDVKDIEKALELNQWEEVLAPVRTRIVTELETSLNAFMINNCSHQLGTAGTAIDKWSDVAQTNAFMQSLGVPSDNNRYAQINPYSQVALADAQSGLFSAGKVDTAWERAQISTNFGGVMAYTSNALNNHTNGNQVSNAGITVASAPTQTYLSTKDTYTMQLALTGLTANTGTINSGDVIQVTAASGGVFWLNQQTKEAFPDGVGNFVKWTATVLTGGTAGAGGNLTVVVTGPSIFEADGAYNSVSQAIASGDAVSVISGATDGQIVQPNLFYHKSAFGLCTVKLPPLGYDSSTVSYEGMSIRVCKYFDGDANKHQYRFDLLPAFAAYNPYMAGKFYGNTP